MKHRAQPYLPAFFSGFEDELSQVIEVETLDDVRRLPWVERWLTTRAFYRLSYSPGGLRANWDWRDGEVDKLMCETDDGARWYVIGGLEDAAGIEGLPRWDSEEAWRKRRAAGLDAIREALEEAAKAR